MKAKCFLTLHRQQCNWTVPRPRKDAEKAEKQSILISHSNCFHYREQCKTSQVTYVTMVPRVGNETLRPLGALWGTPPAWLVPEETYEKTPSVGRRQPMTSLPARPQYKDGRANTSSASSSEACVRSMAPKPRGRSVSFPTRGTMVTYVTWDVPLHGNFELRPLGDTMGNVIPTPPCWGECKPNSRRRRAQVNSTIWLRELPLFGRLMLSVTLSPSAKNPSCIPEVLTC